MLTLKEIWGGEVGIAMAMDPHKVSSKYFDFYNFIWMFLKIFLKEFKFIL